MAEPQLQIEQRLDRIEKALETLAEDSLDPERIKKILRGESSDASE